MQEELNRSQPLRDWPVSDSIRLTVRFLALEGQPQLEQFFAQNPELRESLWPVYARVLTQNQKAEKADEILRQRVPVPTQPTYGENTSPAFLRGLIKVNSNVFAAAAALTQRYYEAGEKAAALDVFSSLRLTRSTPNYFNYWGARLLWETGE